MATARKSAAKTEQKVTDKTTTASRTPVNEAKMKAFEDALKFVNKEIDSETGTLIAKLSDRPMDVEVISTGSVVLDAILGGGLPRGRLIECYGSSGSGKTSCALTAAGNVQKNGGTVAFIDLENALDPRYARKLGVDTDMLAVAQPDYAEQALNLVHRLTSSGAFDLIIVDSIAAMVPKAELEGNMEQVTVGLLARLMSRALRQLVSLANKTGTTVIFINQTRDQIGGFSPFGTPQTTPGGKAMQFYASQRIEVKRLGQVKDGKEIIGNEVRMTIRKNKIAPPFGVGTTVLTFNKGINRAAEMIETGPDYGVIIKPNNRTYVNAITGEVIATSKAEAVAALEKDPAQLEALEAELKGLIQSSLFDDNAGTQSEDPDQEEKPDDEPELDEDGLLIIGTSDLEEASAD